MTAEQKPLAVIFGCNGPIGRELAGLLVDAGYQVRGVCRSGRADLHEGFEVVAGDASQPDSSAPLCAGAETVYSCIGIDYTRWRALWPPIVEGLLETAARSGARLVFADNLYAYGPVEGPLTEDLPGTDYGSKPALRAQMAERMLEAHARGRVRVAIGRASDFYGPGAAASHLGDRVFEAALRGSTARVLGDLDQPHTFTFTRDFARGLMTLGQQDAALGEIWHVPSAPARPYREVLEMVFRLTGHEPRVSAMPRWLLAALALVSPMMRELKEMEFLFDRPYLVDHCKFASHFGGDYTSLEDGLRITVDWYRQQPVGR